MKGGRLPGLDALRGIAALTVFAYHLTATPNPHDLLQVGYLAVHLFFMLSGYVMARTYEERLREGWSVRRFIRARYRRLWLPYAIGCALGFAVLAQQQSLSQAALILALGLLFLPAPIPSSPWMLNGPGWSLSFEIAANIVHGLVLSRLPIRWLFALLALTVAGMTVTATYRLAPPTTYSAFPSIAFQAIAPYIGGILIYRLLGDKPAFRFRAPLAVFVASILFGGQFDELLFGLFFVVALCPMIVIGSLGAGYGAKGTFAAGWLGRLSYPLYVVQAPIFALLSPFGKVAEGCGALCFAVLLTLALEPSVRQKFVPSFR